MPGVGVTSTGAMVKQAPGLCAPVLTCRVSRPNNWPVMQAILLVLAAYLLGSVSSAVLTTRVLGLPDPRTTGSGNPGATNVLRYGGKAAAVVTLLGDGLKGYLPVLAGHWLGAAPAVLGAAGFAAFLGHLFPVFFGFKGGKGVATTLGVLLGLGWPIGVATAATWLALAAVFRYSSLAALGAVLLAPVYTAWFSREGVLVAAVGAMTLVLLWRHRANIRRLLAGEEPKIGASRPSA